MKRIGALCLALLEILHASPARAGSPGNEVVVVYNTRVPESRALAEYYARRRHLPAAQVLGFALSANPAMSRREFHDALEVPLAKALEEKKLWRHTPVESAAPDDETASTGRRVVHSSIRYVVLCYGVPVRILEDHGLEESGVERLTPQLRRNAAAVDSELAALPRIEQGIRRAGPLPNPLYGTADASALDPTNGILLVTRLDGPSVEVARGLVDKALEAEAHGLWGRAYFDLRNVSRPPLRPGDDQLRVASEVSRRLGFETIVDDRPATFSPGFPMSHIALYAGWYAGAANGPFARRKVEFMPGAFAYHLHSFSGEAIRSDTKRWVGPLLARGATATMGCVAEPYLSFTPDIGVFLARWIGAGFSFGEAAYASQNVLSWQTTVVGDPLYRPFQRTPEELNETLARAHSPLVEWSRLRLVDLAAAQGASLREQVALLEKAPETPKSAVLTEKLAELRAAQGEAEAAAALYRRALALRTSPQQRVRLRLDLADQLGALGRRREAYDDLRELQRESPEYPDERALVRKLLTLARQLHDEREIARCSAELEALAPNPAKPSKPAAPPKPGGTGATR